MVPDASHEGSEPIAMETDTTKVGALSSLVPRGQIDIHTPPARRLWVQAWGV